MRIEFHEIIDSTQRRARELVERDDRRWDAVCAAHQTAGRGRQGAHWHDAPGQSLLVSVILWETPLPEPAGLVGLFAALATAQALETRFPDLPPVQLKYPNDLMIHGRKLGGVLTEIVGGVAIVGIGVNLEQTEFPAELQEKAISVRMAVRPHPPAPLRSHAVGAEGSIPPRSRREREDADKGTTLEFNTTACAYLFALTPNPSPTLWERGAADTCCTVSSPSPTPWERGAADTCCPVSSPSPTPWERGAADTCCTVSSPSPTVWERGVGGEGYIDLIPLISQNLTRLREAWRTCPEEVLLLWRVRDCSAGRAYRILDLPDQPVGVALGVAPDFRLRLRLPDGAEHTTYYVSAV